LSLAKHPVIHVHKRPSVRLLIDRFTSCLHAPSARRKYHKNDFPSPVSCFHSRSSSTSTLTLPIFLVRSLTSHIPLPSYPPSQHHNQSREREWYVPKYLSAPIFLAVSNPSLYCIILWPCLSPCCCCCCSSSSSSFSCSSLKSHLRAQRTILTPGQCSAISAVHFVDTFSREWMLSTWRRRDQYIHGAWRGGQWRGGELRSDVLEMGMGTARCTKQNKA
jgi:hypothetical protein